LLDQFLQPVLLSEPSVITHVPNRLGCVLSQPLRNVWVKVFIDHEIRRYIFLNYFNLDVAFEIAAALASSQDGRSASAANDTPSIL